MFGYLDPFRNGFGSVEVSPSKHCAGYPQPSWLP